MGLAAFLAALPVLPVIAVAVVVGVGTLATTGRLMRWVPETSPGRALAVTVAIASLTMLSDATLIAIAWLSVSPVRPLLFLAIGASSARIACSVVTLAHVRGIVRAYR